MYVVLYQFKTKKVIVEEFNYYYNRKNADFKDWQLVGIYETLKQAKTNKLING